MGQRNLVLVAMVTNEYMLRPCYFTNRLIKNVSTVNTSAYLFYSFHLCKNHRKARALESPFNKFFLQSLNLLSSANFTKFFRISLLQNTSRQMFLLFTCNLELSCTWFKSYKLQAVSYDLRVAILRK